MAADQTTGVNGELRRLTSAELGLIIRTFREHQGIKRAALAAEAHVSEKTIERAESGEGINEDSCRRIASALGLQEDAFTRELSIPTPDAAVRMWENEKADRERTHRPYPVRELRTRRDVLALFGVHSLIADDQCVAEGDLREFAELKQSLIDWSDLAVELSEPDRVSAADDLLREIREFEALGYVIKGGTARRWLTREGSTARPSEFTYALLVAFRKPRGSRDTMPEEVWLPRKMPMRF